jgi:hypothetical protein
MQHNVADFKKLHVNVELPVALPGVMVAVKATEAAVLLDLLGILNKVQSTFLILYTEEVTVLQSIG